MADRTLDLHDSGILPDQSSASFTTMHSMLESSHNDSLSDIIPPQHANQPAGVGSKHRESSQREDTSDIRSDSSKHPPVNPSVVDTIPPQMPTVDVIQFPRSPGIRIFLDICCGVNSPLSSAVIKLKGDVMKFDILVHTSDDLLDSNKFEQLLRLCASGIVAYTAASPSCCEYSRLKLLPNGPPALRTPQHLDGIPGLSGPELLRVQESSTMLHRCIDCLQVTVASGGHGHLEQPKSAMSWSEPIVQQFISQHACSCISMSACGFGRNWHKFWLFASTFAALVRMACSCNHPWGAISK